MLSMNRRRFIAATAMSIVAVSGLSGCRGVGEDSTGGTDPGITADTILLGFTSPYTGSLAGNGLPLKDGIEAYVASVNDEGGIGGRTIKLKDYDNAYDPARTIDAARRLVEQDKVFALFGTIGTPTNVAMRDFLASRNVPNLFMGTGDESALGDSSWATSALASYPDEASVYTRQLLKIAPSAKIAVIYQNDDLGKAQMKGIEATIEGTQASIVARESYEVTDASVSAQLNGLAGSGADSLVVVATGKSASQVYSTLAGMAWKPANIVANSTASTIPGLEAAGFDNVQGLVSTLYLKDPSDPLWEDDPGMQKYLEVMKKYAPDADVSNYYTAAGYNYAQITVEALSNMKEPTREAAMEAARNLPTTQLDMLLPGVTVQTTPDNLHAITALQPVQFQGTGWKLIGEPVGIAE